MYLHTPIPEIPPLDVYPKPDVEALWSMLKAHDKTHEVMQAGTDFRDHVTPKYGLVKGHAYTVIGVTQIYTQRLVKLRNPWGKEKYTGPWCDNCERHFSVMSDWDSIDEGVKNSLSLTFADDGVFYIRFEDYYENFLLTSVNFDISDGDWYDDHYLFLNDEDRRDSTSASCINCTKHEFKLTNNSDEPQKAYV